MNKSTIKTLSIVASVLIGISAFLPYLSVSAFGVSASAKLVDGSDGYILLGIAVIALIFSFLEKYIPNIILGVASLGLFFLENGSVSRSLSGMDSTSAAMTRSLLQNGIGYYFLLIGSIALIVISVLGIQEKKKKE